MRHEFAPVELHRAHYNRLMDNVSRPHPRTFARGERGDPERANEAFEALPPEEEIQDASDLLKAVGDPTRMRILCVLLPGEELSVGEIQHALGMSQSAVSHQLRVLRDANLVKHRRSGKMVYYSLADDHVRELLQGTLEHVRHD